MKNWEPADCMTQDFFNPHGLKEYDAILMSRTDTDEGYAPYDLTILDGSPSSVHGLHYLAEGCACLRQPELPRGCEGPAIIPPQQFV